jgi:hypothetical protein
MSVFERATAWRVPLAYRQCANARHWQDASGTGKVLLEAALILLAALARPADGRQERDSAFRMIRGGVVAESGSPLAGAIVCIVSAEAPVHKDFPSDGCDRDCGKHTVTDARGNFTIPGLNPRMLFTVHVEAKGYLAASRLIHPLANRPIEIELVEREPKWDDSTRRVVGQVLRPEGSPAAGAVVTLYSSLAAGRRNRACKIDPTATTDSDGRFTMTSDQPLAQLGVTITAKEATGSRIYWLKPGAAENTLQLIEGASLTGRVLHNARAVEGVAIGVSGVSLRGEMIGPYQSVTDRDGRFAIEHVNRLFARMESLVADNLAAVTQQVRSGVNGQSVEVGELNLHPAHRVHGRIMMADGQGVPANTRAVIERIRAADLQETAVDAKGHFSFQEIPSEQVALSFHTSGIRRLQIC